MKNTLKHYLLAQQENYEDVLRELHNGRKETHWIWYIFPQIDGLAQSETAKFYAIKSKDQAKVYLQHPILSTRLQECTQAVIDIENKSISEIFGFPDDLKFKSSMTLFAIISPENSIFHQALDQYYLGEYDDKTVNIIEDLN